MSLASWAAALRIARREAWRGKLRSLLVIALIGVPVLILTAADVIYQTYDLSPTDRTDRQIGQADAWIDWVGQGVVTVDPGGSGYSFTGPSAPGAPQVPTTTGLLAKLPPGSRAIEYRESSTSTTFVTPAGLSDATMVGFDYRSPIADGMIRQDAGRAPRTSDEVAISRTIAHDTGLGVGDTLRTTAPAHTYRIVGIVTDRNWYDSPRLYSLPTAVAAPAAGDLTGAPLASWLVDTPDPLNPSQVDALGRSGYAAMTRESYLHPPPETSARPSTKAIATSTVIGGMVLLEIVLLAGPAFAVGARRRRRELALVSAVGGNRAHLRRVVLADALVLGATAGVVGAAGGVALAAGLEGWTLRFANTLPGSFDVPFLHLAGLLLVSIGTAVLAALAPAVRAARTDVVAALAGRRGVLRTRAWVPLSGAAVAALGAAIVLGTFGAASATSLLFGVALVEVGLIITSPAVIAFVARLARWLPLSGRIALRDASRNRAAAAPAVAAVMASVIGAMAAGIGTASAAAQNRANYLPSLPQRDSYIELAAHPDAANAALAALRKAVPDAHATVVHTVAGSCDVATDQTKTCVTINAGRSAADAGPSGWFGLLPGTMIDDGSGLDAILGRHDSAAIAALRAGRVLVTDPAYLRSGRVFLEALAVTYKAGAGPAPATPRHTTTAPASLLTHGYQGFQVIVPPVVAARLHVAAAPVGVLETSDHPLTAAQRQALAAALAATGPGLQFDTEHGYSDSTLWLPYGMVGAAALIAILAALIATALANIDSRDDLTVLASVGASPGTRRVLSFSRAAVIAGIGTVIGAIAGILPARAWVKSIGAPVVIPWTAVGAAVVGIPLLAAVLAWLFTRARLPSERAA